MTTYSIAHCDNVLWALAPDDDEDSFKRQLQTYRDQLDMFELGEKEGDLIIERGLTLTDELQFDDDLVWTGGSSVGDLSVKPGLAFRYAVRRNKERIMELMQETIETLIELDEPEALLTTLKRAAQKQKGERWQKLARALERAEATIENENEPNMLKKPISTADWEKHMHSGDNKTEAE
jgi:hypothetical protein